jgi:type I restriction enzyme S subunit
MSEPPVNGWEEQRLSDLLESLESGSRPRGGVRGILDGVPSVGGEHLSASGGFNFEATKYVPRPFFEAMRRGRIRQGDVLIVKDGATTGKVSLVRDDFPFDEAVVNEHVFVCRPQDVSSEYLFWFLYSDEGQRRILAHFRGSAQGGIAQDFASGTHVPVADRRLQDLIATTLRAVDLKRRAADSHLANAQRTIERFRQSVLAAACSGRLTVDWRSSVGRVDESDQPAGWSDATVASLAANVPRAIQSGPFGSNLKHSEFQATGPLVIGIDNVLDGRFVLGSQHRISEAKFAELKKYEARPLDVLITVMATVGRVCVVPEDIEPSIITKHVYRITVDQERVLPLFLLHALRGHPKVREQIHTQSRGQTRPGINGQIVKGLVIAVPPLDEQREIVKRVDQLLALADGLHKKIDSASDRIVSSSQAVLAKAFRGELLPSTEGLDV